MPEMDGAETSRQMVSLFQTWNFSPLIVGCSADNSQQTQQSFVEAGVSHFLNKPIHMASITNLKKSLIEHLEKTNSSRHKKSEATFSQASDMSHFRKRNAS